MIEGQSGPANLELPAPPHGCLPADLLHEQGEGGFRVGADGQIHGCVALEILVVGLHVQVAWS